MTTMETQSSNSSRLLVLLDGLESTVPLPLEDDDLLPRWFLWTYIIVFGVGGLFFNGVLAGYLIRRTSISAILHMCFADIATLMFVAPYEILVLAESSGVWLFPKEFCPIFLGLEVLLGTATIYIIIVLNFSSVIGSDTSFSMIPLITVWLLSVSLSVPDFIFGEVLTPRLEHSICCLPKRAVFLVNSFRLVLPVFLLLVGTVVVTLSYFNGRRDDSLRLALVWSWTYIAVSVQRSVFGVLHGTLFTTLGPSSFRTPPLADVTTQHPLGTLYLALLHYTLSAVRPFLFWGVSSDLQSSVVCVPATTTNQLV